MSYQGFDLIFYLVMIKNTDSTPADFQTGTDGVTF